VDSSAQFLADSGSGRNVGLLRDQAHERLSKALRCDDGLLSIVAALKRYHPRHDQKKPELIAELNDIGCEARVLELAGVDSTFVNTDSIRYGCELSELTDFSQHRGDRGESHRAATRLGDRVRRDIDVVYQSRLINEPGVPGDGGAAKGGPTGMICASSLAPGDARRPERFRLDEGPARAARPVGTDGGPRGLVGTPRAR
jgi:hypothetical protein